MENNTKLEELIQLLQDEYIVEQNPSSTNLVYQAFQFKKYNLAIIKYLHMRDASLNFKKIITPDIDLYNQLKAKSTEELEQMKENLENTACPHCAAIVWQAPKFDYECDSCNNNILVQTLIRITIIPTIELDLYELSNKIDITIENREKIPQPVIPLPKSEVSDDHDKLIIDFYVDVYVKDSKSKCNLEDFNLNCQDLNLDWIRFQVVEN